MKSIAAILKELGHEMPPVSKPAGQYMPIVAHGGVIYLSGQVSKRADGQVYAGKVGVERNIEEARQAALLSALHLIAQIDQIVGGNVAGVGRVLKLTGYVNGERDFVDLSSVLDGASELFVSVFGPSGRHSRSSVGVHSLPRGASVEIEAIVAIDRAVTQAP